MYINFAHRTFVWSSEAKQKTSVHCVIIGFAAFGREIKLQYQNDQPKQVQNINAYLCDAPNVIVESRNKPLCEVSPMVYGNKPADGGNLIIEDVDYQNFITKEPQAQNISSHYWAQLNISTTKNDGAYGWKVLHQPN